MSQESETPSSVTDSSMQQRKKLKPNLNKNWLKKLAGRLSMRMEKSEEEISALLAEIDNNN